MKIRSVQFEDAAAMLDIYLPYVRDTHITFETVPPTLDEFQQRIVDKRGKYPWLVCEIDHQIVGYAYADSFRTRAAYAWSVETSVYVRRDICGKGVGKALYSDLLRLLKDQGVVNVIGGMTLPNAPSKKLHEYFGFAQIAIYKDIGFKQGKWWDVGHWHLQLQKPEVPKPLLAPKESFKS